MSRSSPEAVLHGRSIRMWVQWPLDNEDSGFSRTQAEVGSAAQETPLKEPAPGRAEQGFGLGRANLTWLPPPSHIHDRG